MGRRPSAVTSLSKLGLNLDDPKVRKLVSDIKLLLYQEILAELKNRIASGKVKELPFEDLLEHLQKTERATRAPMTSITAIQVPQSLNAPVRSEREGGQLWDYENDIAARRDLRRSAVKHIEKDEKLSQGTE